MFRLAGISVYLHWSWFLVAAFELQYRTAAYTSRAWNVAEYLSLFAIVLLHEFGHALACRQVGGQANRIVLWPLGGVAFVSPPPRPGAWLWSIAAGPLVNVLLAPILVGAVILAALSGLGEANPDASHFIGAVAYMNLTLLVFNLLPVYPLDGGQILQSLLWFVIGRARSLLVVSVIGLLAGVGAVALAVVSQDVWLGVIAVFVAMRSWAGFGQARLLARVAAMPRRREAACPSCGTHPLVGDFWECARCHGPFDVFRHRGMCPDCGNTVSAIACPECQRAGPIAAWFEPDDAAEWEPTPGES
jgi:Zn-dependent protease